MTPRGRPDLDQFGIRRGAYQRAMRDLSGGQVGGFLRALFAKPDGSRDGLPLAIARADGGRGLAVALAPVLGRPADGVAASLSAYLDGALADGLELTGADATALVLRQERVQTAFAYAGTSELAMCDSIARTPGVRLINGRGDSASVFMAAGGSLLAPGRGLAVLHGARGLTHATGAIADARRNEVGLLALIGLPSTRSARFLPPHGEPDLIARIGSFAKWSDQLGPVPDAGRDRTALARRYVASLRSALRLSRTPPAGPSLIGIPQDVAEDAWLPLTAIDPPAVEIAGPVPAPDRLDAAARLLAGRSRVLILIDDYLLRHDLARPALADFARSAGALVVQARYRRGAMLFERLHAQDVPSFLGWYDPMNPAHRALMAEADLLVTVEDRNLYERVVGPLPPCRKIAITSDAAKAAKNEYLGDADLVVQGNPVTVLRMLTERLAQNSCSPGPPAWNCAAPDAAAPDAAVPDAAAADNEVAGGAVSGCRTRSELAGELRAGLVRVLSDAARQVASPVIVDDSQMFGGLICGEYDQLPARLRVFGDHCGFVGSGISYAAGLAISDPSVRVFCLLGDQAFTNGLQGLVAVGEERPSVVFLVCNNGQSVSLLTQAAARPGWFEDGCHPHLRNPPAFDYQAAARSLGLRAWRIEIALDRGKRVLDRGLARFRDRLAKAVSDGGPALIELRLPASAELWDGIWLDRGFDEATPSPARARARSSGRLR